MTNVNFLNYFNYKSGVFRVFVTLIFFVSILIIGLISVNDYGTTNDEYTQRLNGFITLNYLGEIFLPELTNKYTFDKNFPSFDNMPDNLRFYGGAILHAPLGFLEIIFGVEDKKNVFLFKHYAFFLIFFISLICFFDIINRRFKNWKYGLLGVSLIFLSPRIFANSFYNNLDIPFMAFLTITACLGMRFLRKPNKKYIFLFSLFSAISIDIRLIGIILPVLICTTFFFHGIKKKDFKNTFITLFSVFFMTVFLVVLFWPMLWENPFQNFLSVITNLAHHPLKLDIFFFGETIRVDNVPWYYLPTWIFISNPILYSLLFIFGVSLIAIILIGLTKRMKSKSIDIIFFLLILIPILIPILLGSTLYNGWRHVYFIYPFMVYFMIFFIFFIIEKIDNKKINFIVKLLLFLGLLDVSFWMFKNHPHQYVFFNKITREDVSLNFEMDYIAASYKENLEFLINNEKKDSFNIFNSSKTEIWYSLFSLYDSDRLKIVESNKENADYWITNYWFDDTVYNKSFLDKFEILNEVIVDGNKINTLFKRKN